MSETKEIIVCSACGATNYSDSDVCVSCGFRLNKPEVAQRTQSVEQDEREEETLVLEEDVEDDSDATEVQRDSVESSVNNVYFEKESYDFNLIAATKENTGFIYNQENPDESVPRMPITEDESTGKADRTKITFGTGIVGGFILFITSVVLLLTVLFLPLSYSSLAYDERSSWSIEFSGTDSVKLSYYALQEKSDKQIVRSSLYKTTVKKFDEILSSGTRPDRMSELKYQRLVSLTNNMLYLSLASDEVGAPADVLISAACFFIFVIADVVMLFSSLSVIVKSLFSNPTKKFGSSGAMKVSIKSLWTILTFLPLMIYSFYQMSHWGIGARLGMFSSAGCGLGAGSYIIIVVVTLAVVYSVIYLLKGKNNAILKNKDDNKKRIAAALISVVMMVSLLLPWLTVGVAKHKGRRVTTENVSVSMSELHCLTDEDANYYFEISSMESEELLKYQAAQIVESKEDNKNAAEEILELLVFGVYRYNISAFYNFVYAMLSIQLLLCGMLLSRIGKNLFFEAENISKEKKLRVLVSLASIVISVLSIIYLIISHLSIEDELSYYVTVNVGIGPLLGIALSIAMILTLCGVKKENCIEQGYDNADVSYAPYILRVKKR